MKEDAVQAKRKLVGSVESERRRIGEELHDGICQTLSSTTLLLEALGRAVAAQKPVAPEVFEKLKQALELAVSQARGMSQRFNPANIEGAGLMTALHQLAAEIPNSEFLCEKPVFISDPERALALYRVAEQALDNVIKHAGARRIRIHLAHKDGSAVLTVADDGIGFIPGPEGDRLSGLNLMRIRAEAVAGSLSIRSVPDRGTSVVCAVPLG
jgi:signal transduction histidine kinase